MTGACIGRTASGRERRTARPSRHERYPAGIPDEVRKQAGDTVGQDEVLLVIEAMKMLNELRAGVPGRLSAVHVEAGSRVELGMPLLEVSET